jgi:hypothetical protein
MRERRAVGRAVVALALVALGRDAGAQSVTELKKQLLPVIKKAQQEGRDLGVAAEEYKAGDEALKNGLQEEAVEHFQKAKAALPADATK